MHELATGSIVVAASMMMALQTVATRQAAADRIQAQTSAKVSTIVADLNTSVSRQHILVACNA